MNKRYKFLTPTPEKCMALGIKHEGLVNRIQLWLAGVAYGVSYVAGDAHFSLQFTNLSSLIVETNSATLINNVTDHLKAYGFERTDAILNCPSCNGQREESGKPGIYSCLFCGLETT